MVRLAILTILALPSAFASERFFCSTLPGDIPNAKISFFPDGTNGSGLAVVTINHGTVVDLLRYRNSSFRTGDEIGILKYTDGNLKVTVSNINGEHEALWLHLAAQGPIRKPMTCTFLEFQQQR